MSLSSRTSSSGGSIGSRGQSGPPDTGYFAYRHQPGFDDGEYEPIQFRPATGGTRYSAFGNGDPPGENKKMGSVSVQDGAINLHIPCAFSYGYDGPKPPQQQSKSSTMSSRSSKHSVITKDSIVNKKTGTRPMKNGTASSVDSSKQLPGRAFSNSQRQTGTKPNERSMGTNPDQRSAATKSNQRVVTKKDQDSAGLRPGRRTANVPTGETRNAFVGTVKSGEMYNAKKVPIDHRTQARTTMVWDMKPAASVPFRVVDYAEELYEMAAQNLASQLKQQKLDERKTSTEDEINDNCIDYSKPGINSSRYVTKALEKAVQDLKNLPKDVETLLREDKRFEALVAAKATRALNAPRSSKVFQNLIPVDPNPDVMTEAEQMIQAEIKKSIEAARPPPRLKDPEPKLEDFQTNSYTRIRPATVPPPSKPTSGTSIESNHDFDTIQDENRIHRDSNKF